MSKSKRKRYSAEINAKGCLGGDQGRKWHWININNIERPHPSLDEKTPDEAYWLNSRPGYAGPDIRLAASP